MSEGNFIDPVLLDPEGLAAVHEDLCVGAYRIKKYIGAFTAALESVDAIVFTAGIGENSPDTRKLSCQGLEQLGIEIDLEKNIHHMSELINIISSKLLLTIILVKLYFFLVKTVN